MSRGYTFSNLDDIRDIASMVRDRRTSGNVDITPPIVQGGGDEIIDQARISQIGTSLSIAEDPLLNKYKIGQFYIATVFGTVPFTSTNQSVGFMVGTRIVRIINNTTYIESEFANFTTDFFTQAICVKEIYMTSNNTTEVFFSHRIAFTIERTSNDLLAIQMRVIPAVNNNYAFSPFTNNNINGLYFHENSRTFFGNDLEFANITKTPVSQTWSTFGGRFRWNVIRRA